MALLIGAFTIGLVLSLLALGVFISFRVFHVADITAEGSITLGASITATLLVAGVNPVLATAAGFGGGMIAGTTQDIDALAEGIKARGGKLDQEPRDQPWGTRDFALTDPDGFKLTIGANTKKR